MITAQRIFVLTTNPIKLAPCCKLTRQVQFYKQIQPYGVKLPTAQHTHLYVYSLNSNYTAGVCTHRRVWCNKPKQADEERRNCREIKCVCLLSLSVLFPPGSSLPPFRSICTQSELSLSGLLWVTDDVVFLEANINSSQKFASLLLPCEFYSWQDETSSGWTLIPQDTQDDFYTSHLDTRVCTQVSSFTFWGVYFTPSIQAVGQFHNINLWQHISPVSYQYACMQLMKWNLRSRKP